MAEGRCHSCTHWQTGEASREEFGIGPILPLDPGWGWCRNVKYENTASDARAVVDCDYADSAPYLLTRSEFGCVDHEQETVTVGGVESALATGDRVILPEGRTGEVRTVSPNGNCYVRLDSGNTAWIHSARLRRQE